MKSHRIIGILLLLGAAGVGFYLWYLSRKQSQTAATATGGSSTSGTSSPLLTQLVSLLSAGSNTSAGNASTGSGVGDLTGLLSLNLSGSSQAPSQSSSSTKTKPTSTQHIFDHWGSSSSTPASSAAPTLTAAQTNPNAGLPRW